MELRARPAGLLVRLLLLLPLLSQAAAPPAPGAAALQVNVTVLGEPSEPPRAGTGVTVSCRARGGPPGLTLLYWLGNGSFVERLYPDGAVREGALREEPGAALRRDLLVGAWGARERSTNFTCVALSPCGHAARPARWPPAWGPGLG